MNGNWSQLDMTTSLGASATQAWLALAAFWAMVTVGRVLFAAVGRWLPERATYRILPFVLVGTFLLTGVLSRPRTCTTTAMSPEQDPALPSRSCLCGRSDSAF